MTARKPLPPAQRPEFRGIARTLLGLVLATGAYAQNEGPVVVEIPPGLELPDPADGVLPAKAWTKLNAMSDCLVDAVMSRNNWATDQDQFALKIHQRLANTPPFDLDQRFQVVVDAVGERYQLDRGQRARLKGLMLRQGMQFMVANGRQVKQVMDQIKADELWDQPMTPELVAKYSQLYKPMMDAAHESMEQLNNELHAMLNDRQKELHLADWQHGKARFESMRETLTKWEQGDWKPAEWGLNDDGTIPAAALNESRIAKRIARGPDPAQRPAVAALNVPGARPAEAPQVDPQNQPGTPPPLTDGQQQSRSLSIGSSTEWAQFVDRYVAFYGLDQAQQASARAVLTDVDKRADPIRTRNAERQASIMRQLADPALGEAKRMQLSDELADLAKPIRPLFEELVSRLDRLLTGEQARIGKPPGHPALDRQPTTARAEK